MQSVACKMHICISSCLHFTHMQNTELIAFNLKVKMHTCFTHAKHMQLIVHFVFAFCTDIKCVQPVFK